MTTTDTSAALLAEFADRAQATREQITRVLDRWNPPSPYRSYADYERELAAAYEARAAFWRAVTDHIVTTPSGVPQLPRGLMLHALLDARLGAHDQAVDARRHARESAQRDQERALATYADNISAALRTDTPAGPAVLREVA